MSEGSVDLSQIRGDWKFHIDYLTNALNSTVGRQTKLCGELPTGAQDAQIEKAIQQQKSLWDTLNGNANSKGTIPTADDEYLEFISACRDSKSVCDELQGRDESIEVEEFTEACRQTRALCDDLEMMREQRPDTD
jgi:hypothetical protein